jgi:HEAT repeat protein
VLGIVAGALGDANRSAPDPIITSAIGHAQAALIELASNHESEVIRVSALTGLISIGAEDALSAVYEIGAKDPNEMVRCRVLSASGDFISQPRGARVSLAHVRTLLRKSLNPKSVDEPLGIYRRAIFESLYFSKVEPEGERRSDCVDANETAMWWLGSLNDPEAIPHLIRAAQSSDPALQAVAGWGLPRFNQPVALEQVEALLKSPLAGVRSAAIEGLGRSKHPGSDARLIQILKEDSRLDRREAARALAGSFGASLALIDAFSDQAVEVRDEAEHALLRSDVVVGKLEDSLANAVAEISGGRGTAVLSRRVQRIRDGLERWRGEQREAEQALALGLGADDRRIRTRSARVLSRYKSASSLRLMIEVLDARKSLSSESAALALGLRGDASARESLERAAGSDSETLSVAAIRALQDLNLKASLPLLRTLQAKTDNSPRKSDAVRYTIAILEQVETVD